MKRFLLTVCCLMVASTAFAGGQVQVRRGLLRNNTTVRVRQAPQRAVVYQQPQQVIVQQPVYQAPQQVIIRQAPQRILVQPQPVYQWQFGVPQQLNGGCY